MICVKLKEFPHEFMIFLGALELDYFHGVIMQKSLIIVVFGAILLLSISAQMYSINRSNPIVSGNYYSIH